MIISPWNHLWNKQNQNRHPLHISNNKNQPIDFWGPFGIVTLLILILWIGRAREVSWIYVIWGVAAVFNHFVTRVWYRSRLLAHIALLGYSSAPLIPFVVAILLFRPNLWITVTLEMLAVIWGSSAAILSYSYVIIATNGEIKKRIPLLYPIVVIMHFYLMSLLP
jgi:hypothetical protein